MADKKSVDYSGKLEAAEVAAYLEALGRSLRDGRVVIESGANAVEFAVAGPVDIQLDARSLPEKGRCSLSLELEWRSTARVIRKPAASLTIASARSDAVPLAEPAAVS